MRLARRISTSPETGLAGPPGRQQSLLYMYTPDEQHLQFISKHLTRHTSTRCCSGPRGSYPEEFPWGTGQHLGDQSHPMKLEPTSCWQGHEASPLLHNSLQNAKHSSWMTWYTKIISLEALNLFCKGHSNLPVVRGTDFLEENSKLYWNLLCKGHHSKSTGQLLWVPWVILRHVILLVAHLHSKYNWDIEENSWKIIITCDTGISNKPCPLM